jgi:hypothetical protein
MCFRKAHSAGFALCEMLPYLNHFLNPKPFSDGIERERFIGNVLTFPAGWAH